MLQQTQVTAAIPYYERFLARFPDVRALASADIDDVLAHWSGLGYYARARNLHRAAQEAVAKFGAFPTDFEALESLPGIGRSTAAAIAAFATGARQPILDGNVKRVLARHAGIGGDPSSSAVLKKLWACAEERLAALPSKAGAVEAYTQGLMDLGATVCLARTPTCAKCPVASDCVALAKDRIAELPGKKAKRENPRRRIGMLVVISKGEVLLEKRPAKGIWGGLWSLPEVPAGKKPKGAVALEPFEHAFSHFTLEVTPWLMGTGTFENWGSDSNFRGGRPLPRKLESDPQFSNVPVPMNLAEIEGAALPAPVKKLLLAIRRSASAGAGSGGGKRRGALRPSVRAASASRRSAKAGSRRGGS
jgi:A/G-specific adenine glycosylase